MKLDFRRRIIIFFVTLLTVVTACAALFFMPPLSMMNMQVSGRYLGNRIWSGTITVTGDTTIFGDLSVAPGTRVRFVVGDDRKSGDEIAPDGFNDADPTRLNAYERSHTDLIVLGKILAVGSGDQPVIFTSSSDQPALADWQGIDFMGDGSIFDHVIIEYGRNSLTPIGHQPGSIIRNSVIRHSMWGCISGGHSSMQVIENDISDCGHEGVDVQGGGGIIRGNHIHDSHTGIVVLSGDPIIEDNVIANVGDGIAAPAPAVPRLRNNSITLAPQDSHLEWRYGDFAYSMYDRP